MPRYTHSFDTRIAISFDSDIEDFEEAFDAWIAQFPDFATKLAALLNGDESTKTLMEGVIWGDTDLIEDTQDPFAGDLS